MFFDQLFCFSFCFFSESYVYEQQQQQQEDFDIDQISCDHEYDFIETNPMRIKQNQKGYI